jgi:hypothetical protein
VFKEFPRYDTPIEENNNYFKEFTFLNKNGKFDAKIMTNQSIDIAKTIYQRSFVYINSPICKPYLRYEIFVLKIIRVLLIYTIILSVVQIGSIALRLNSYMEQIESCQYLCLTLSNLFSKKCGSRRMQTRQMIFTAATLVLLSLLFMHLWSVQSILLYKKTIYSIMWIGV